MRLALGGTARQRRVDPFVLERRRGRIRDSEQLAQRDAVDDAVALARILDLPVAGLGPLARVAHHAGADHVQVDAGEFRDVGGVREMVVAGVFEAVVMTGAAGFGA